ncbi:hypothetical protein H4R35_001745 [Dimargaris xerosporica]|nr:hypothetical protein H4R35_001745 [Dimargaris xerosporica]
MLDLFTVLTRGGVVLWSKAFTSLQGNPVNDLIQDVLIGEQRLADKSRYTTGPYEVQWTLANEYNLVFVAVFQRVLQLTYIGELLSVVKRRFVTLFGDQLTTNDFKPVAFDQEFIAILNAIEDQNERSQRTRRAPAASVEASPHTKEQEVPDVVSTATHKALRNRKQKGAKPTAEITTTKSKKGRKKEQRVWDNGRVSEASMKAFDFSGTADDESQPENLDHLMDVSAMGQRTADGYYTVQDLQASTPRSHTNHGFDVISTSDDEGIDPTHSAAAVSTTSRLFSFFRGLTSQRTLTVADLSPVLGQMKEHLIAKNVASHIADHICQSVQQSLTNVQLGTFQSIRAAVREAMERTLQRILTPSTSMDLLRDIDAARAQRRPYTIVFVGVNGVGKSTNLSKVCFWLLQNKLKVLIAACDTFRSGAVEQLRVHGRNLRALSENAVVDIFQRGYGRDSAAIAKDAIATAHRENYDVVLIDTAGRMQDNEPLMRALAKLVAVNSPDKIIFVGEALVGNEAVDQLTKFNKALKDFAPSTQTARQIDGIILTKFDTIDDKVGAALSMTYTTGKPILFVGTGQTYTDLRNMSVQHVVQSLMDH